MEKTPKLSVSKEPSTGATSCSSYFLLPSCIVEESNTSSLCEPFLFNEVTDADTSDSDFADTWKRKRECELHNLVCPSKRERIADCQGPEAFPDCPSTGASLEQREDDFCFDENCTTKKVSFGYVYIRYYKRMLGGCVVPEGDECPLGMSFERAQSESAPWDYFESIDNFEIERNKTRTSKV